MSSIQYPGSAAPPPYGASPQARAPQDAPNVINGATVHGIVGQKGMRHPWELPLLGVGVAITGAGYLIWAIILLVTLVNLIRGTGPTVFTMAEGFIGGYLLQIIFLLMAFPLIAWIARALLYAQYRSVSVRMSPTQFPEGYRILAEAAARFGLRRVPDAYVVSGNGVINAFASGHGFRRTVVVHSDLFEVGGAARDREALSFIIGHEVGHLAAGHVSYFRLVFVNLISYVPLLGKAFSRSQEYTADNFGYAHCPEGALGAMSVLAGGKYLNADVNVHEFADRAASEKGLWIHIAAWQSTHPITIWRAHALRDRSKPGHLWLRPGDALWGIWNTPGVWFQGPLPAGSSFSGPYPTPAQALELLDQADAVRPAGTLEQWGRFNGADYSGKPSMREIQLQQPLLSTRVGAQGPGSQGPGMQGPGMQGPGPYGGPGGPSAPRGPLSPGPLSPGPQSPGPQNPAGAGDDPWSQGPSPEDPWARPPRG